jgi:hypothetical protein
MKDAILKVLPNHRLDESRAKKIYIADYKKQTNGKKGIVISDTELEDIKYVRLDNDSELPIYFNGFKESALPIDVGEYSEQCEGVAFPQTCEKSDWVLFIECKYTFSVELAKNEEIDYPTKMISQILTTIEYFRTKGILSIDKPVYAMVAFPNLQGPFDGWFFARIPSATQIKKQYKITIRATNFATIVSSKHIKLWQTK